MSPEWQLVRGFALQWFQGELSEDALDAWRVAFGADVTPEQVTEAMRGYMADDSVPARQREFMPKPGRLLAYLPKPESAVDAPDFASVLSVVDGARFLPRSQAVARMRDRCGETAAAWMCAEGIEALKVTEFVHPEYGANTRKVLGERYDAFVRSAEADVRRGLPAPRATDRGELEARPRGLRPMNFAAVAGRPELEDGTA